MRLALLALLVAACSHAAKHTDDPPPGPRTDGSHGAVCSWGHGEQAHPDTPLAACQSGLSCCYPCGIDGCSSVCATSSECSEWMTLP